MKAAQTKDRTVLAVLSIDEAKALVKALKLNQRGLREALSLYKKDFGLSVEMSVDLVHVNNMLLVLENLSLD